MAEFLHPRVTAPVFPTEGIPMLTILIYIADLSRRALRKFLGGISIVAQSFREAQDLRRALPRQYMEE